MSSPTLLPISLYHINSQEYPKNIKVNTLEVKTLSQLLTLVRKELNDSRIDNIVNKNSKLKVTKIAELKPNEAYFAVPRSQVILNVGGTKYPTSASVLQLFHKSPLFNFTSFPRDSSQGYFIDRDPELFGYILTYLRNVYNNYIHHHDLDKEQPHEIQLFSHLPSHDYFLLRQIREEAKYFQLDELEAACHSLMKKITQQAQYDTFSSQHFELIQFNYNTATTPLNSILENTNNVVTLGNCTFTAVAVREDIPKVTILMNWYIANSQGIYGIAVDGQPLSDFITGYGVNVNGDASLSVACSDTALLKLSFEVTPGKHRIDLLCKTYRSDNKMETSYGPYMIELYRIFNA